MIPDDMLLRIAQQHTGGGAELLAFNSANFGCYAVTLGESESLFYVRDYTREIEPIIAARTLRAAAEELRNQGVIPWDRNSLAIQTLNFLATQIENGELSTPDLLRGHNENQDH